MGPGRTVLVPDTSIYIDVAAGRLPEAARALLANAVQLHSSVALSELLQGVAMYPHSAPDFRRVRRYYADLFRTILRRRILTPDPDTWSLAGILAGTLARTQNYQPQQRKELMADALIFASAAKAGVPVLTRNARDFALLSQLDGSGAVIVC